MNFKSHSKIIEDFKLSTKKSIFLGVFIAGLLIIPTVSTAWSLTSVLDIFSTQDASAQAEAEIWGDNDSTVELTAPPMNFDLSHKTESVLVIEGDALLPETGPLTTAPEEIDFTGKPITEYVVRSGDTPSAIAKMFDLKVDTILANNGLTNKSSLKIGQTLIILPVDGVIYTVKSGDTLSSIARNYKADLKDILSFNDLKATDKLLTNDVIIIPKGITPVGATKATTAKKTSSSSTSYSGPSYGGYYAKPFIVGRKTQGIHGHNAVDYGMPVGSPLYSAADGVVITSKGSGWNGGYGGLVTIKHPNGTQTWYGHMSSTAVSVGQKVTQGQLIGYSGNTGESTGPHLHFEIRGATNPF